MAFPNRTILIVDDDPCCRYMTKKRLSAAGYFCLGAQTIEEAIEHLRDNAIDLVLLDLGFPGYDGADFLQILNDSRSARNLPPVIVLSGFVEQDIVDYVRDLGAKDFIAKPYDPTKLVEMVRAYVAA